jgi:predicted SnoaL-like aldol condensation-catalyzing enzyme
MNAAVAPRVLSFAELVLIGADYSKLTDYISTEQYDQHDVEAADGLARSERPSKGGRLKAGTSLADKNVHRVIAEGDFVFTRTEGEFGVPSIYNDLWRVAGGKIIEHWAVVILIPESSAHDNGVF